MSFYSEIHPLLATASGHVELSFIWNYFTCNCKQTFKSEKYGKENVFRSAEVSDLV